MTPEERLRLERELRVAALQLAVTVGLRNKMPDEWLSTLRLYVGEDFVGWKFADEASKNQYGDTVNTKDAPSDELVASYFIDQIAATVDELRAGV